MNFINKLIKYTLNGRIGGIIWCKIKGYYYTKHYCEGRGHIIFQKPYLKLRIEKHPKGKIILDGNLRLESHAGGRGYITFVISMGAVVRVKNDFGLGQNCKVLLCNDACLTLGGRVDESASGITCDSMIMCYRNISIGEDLICGWNVYITDSDWHSIVKNEKLVAHNEDVVVGDHVWIGSNVIVGKGARIGDRCIVGAYTKISQKSIEADSTVVGIPPKIVSNTTKWKRDI